MINPCHGRKLCVFLCRKGVVWVAGAVNGAGLSAKKVGYFRTTCNRQQSQYQTTFALFSHRVQADFSLLIWTPAREKKRGERNYQ